MIWGPEPYLEKKMPKYARYEVLQWGFYWWHKPTEFWRQRPAERLTSSRETVTTLREEKWRQTWSMSSMLPWKLVFNYQGLKIRNISRLTHWHLLHARHTFVRPHYHEGTSEISPPCWSVGMTDGQVLLDIASQQCVRWDVWCVLVVAVVAVVV